MSIIQGIFMLNIFPFFVSWFMFISQTSAWSGER
jgi:hypothetical protein